MAALFDAAPADAALAWVASTVGRGARVVRVRRLTGGVASTVHGLDVDGPDGLRRRLVLRRCSAGPHPGRELVEREAAILTALDDAGLPTPQLVAVDAGGEHCGRPALLMTRLPGRLDLTPADPATWVRRLAEMLPRIHALEVVASPYEPWLDVAGLQVPGWTRRPALWRDAIELVGSRRPHAEGGFVHHDYQQFNVLWSRGRISGIVDWTWASHGPPDADVAHCRLNLAVLYSADRAEQLRLAYESAAGRQVEPWWDVAGLLGYLPGWGELVQQQAGRRLVVEVAGMHERVEAVLAAALRRAGSL